MLKDREYCKRISEEIERYVAGDAVNDEGEVMTLHDYLEDVLDYDFVIDRLKEYKAAKIWLTLGDPNIWIDTAEQAVKLTRGTDRAEYPLSWTVCEEIDNIMLGIYENRKRCKHEH